MPARSGGGSSLNDENGQQQKDDGWDGQQKEDGGSWRVPDGGSWSSWHVPARSGGVFPWSRWGDGGSSLDDEKGQQRKDDGWDGQRKEDEYPEDDLAGEPTMEENGPSST